MVTQVRRFNRTVTQRIGALSDEYLDRDHTLGQARLLWEIRPDGPDLDALRARLDLDSGRLSRLLRSLEDQGLVVTEASATDLRTRTVRLTEVGLSERAMLDRRSDDLAADILRPLAGGQRTRLVAAMAEVERLLTASAIRVDSSDPRHPNARACLRAYFSELSVRFDGGFDVTRSIPAGDRELTPPAGPMLVANLHDDPVGCGALKFGDGAAEIKRMWVAPAVRGLGLGRRLLLELETRAADKGVRVLRWVDRGQRTGDIVHAGRWVTAGPGGGGLPCHCQTRILASCAAVASRRPLEEKATSSTDRVWPCRTVSRSPVEVSHIRAVRSRLPLASSRPSGLTATACTALECPVRTRS